MAQSRLDRSTTDRDCSAIGDCEENTLPLAHSERGIICPRSRGVDISEQLWVSFVELGPCMETVETVAYEESEEAQS